MQPLRFFCQGDTYEFWGLVEGSLHISSARPRSGQLFLLGTDRLGRDVLSRIIYGARISLTIGLLGIAVSFMLGIVIGGIAGYYGGLFDLIVQRIIEVIQSIPSIPLWMALAAIMPVTWTPILIYFGITVILGLLDWTGLARAVRSKLLALREEDYVLGRAVDGRKPAASSPPPDPRLRVASDRHRDDLHPRHDPRRDRAELPRPRPAAADHQLGRAADRGAEHQRRRALSVAAVARAAGDPRHPGFQLLRRRPEGRGGPLQVEPPRRSPAIAALTTSVKRVILILLRTWMDSDERQNGAQPIQVHLDPFQAPADLDSDHRRPLHADLLPGLRHPEAHRQRADPGQGFESPTPRRKSCRSRSAIRSATSPSPCSGFELDRMGALVALSMAFLGYVIINGMFKLYINTYKGRLGERMLRRLRYQLVDRVLRFPFPQYRRVRSSEIATMIKDEVDPLGGFIGEAFATPALPRRPGAGGAALHHAPELGARPGHAGDPDGSDRLIPKLRGRLRKLALQRQLTARDLSGRVSEIVDGATDIRLNDSTNFERSDISDRLARIFFIRFDFYQWKFMVKFINNFLAQFTPFVFYLAAAYWRSGQSRYRPAGGRYRRLQGPARADQGIDRLGLPAARRAGEISAGGQCLRHHAAGPARAQEVQTGPVPSLVGPDSPSARFGDRRIRQDADHRPRPHDRPARGRRRDRRDRRRRRRSSAN